MSKLFRQFNSSSFTAAAYADYKARVEEQIGTFKTRMCETPIFLDKPLFDQMTTAGAEIVAQAMQPHVLERVKSYVPTQFQTPDTPAHPTLLAVDFAITKDENGAYKPMLIELQAFSSVYAFQHVISQQAKQAYALDDRYQFLPDGGMTFEQSVADLKEAIVGKHERKNVVLLEIDPWNQTTVMDFRAFQKLLGIPVVDVRDVIKKGDKLYYNDGAEDIEIKRVYNRVVPEEFVRRSMDDQVAFKFTDKLDVEWVEHPSWFFMLSKVSMPFLQHANAPETRFLSDLTEAPKDLENYVMKPLFAYGGAGVKIHVTQADIDAVPQDQRDQFILQRKVVYDQFIENPQGVTSKAEIRVMYLWTNELQPAIMMARVSRGELSNMTGAKFTAEDNWIGVAPVMSVDQSKTPSSGKKPKTTDNTAIEKDDTTKQPVRFKSQYAGPGGLSQA